MSKIVAVVDAISSNPDKITRVINLNSHWFFYTMENMPGVSKIETVKGKFDICYTL